MKRVLIFFALIIASVVGFGQQRPIQSLYMFDPLLINPAYAGTHVQLSATAIYRNQWVNFEGAPKTLTASMHSGFNKARVGVGLLFGRDEIGVHSDNSLYLMYAYKIPLSNRKNPAVLSMGIQGGFNSLTSDYYRTIPRDGMEVGALSKFNPNFGAGIFYRSKQMYAGLSCPYMMNNPTIDVVDDELAKLITPAGIQERYYYLMAGTTRKLNEHVKISPSTLIRIQENAPLSLDFNTMVTIYDVVSFGGSYRNKDAVVGLFELKINENFHVGYAYDLTTSSMRLYSNGSHELMINYRIKLQKIHRGLECPSYW